MISYCNGNIEILKLFTFAEITELLGTLIDELNDETLLRAYQASYAALQNLSFEDFKKTAINKSKLQSTAQPTAEQTLAKVERILNNTKWEVT